MSESSSASLKNALSEASRSRSNSSGSYRLNFSYARFHVTIRISLLQVEDNAAFFVVLIYEYLSNYRGPWVPRESDFGSSCQKNRLWDVFTSYPSQGAGPKTIENLPRRSVQQKSDGKSAEAYYLHRWLMLRQSP